MSDLIQSIALSGIPAKGGKDFVTPTGDQFITAGPTREEVRAKAPDRGVFGAINDNVIEIANAAAGGVSSIANMVSPGNRVSKFIEEEIIKPGEEAQSDAVKAEKRMLRQDLENAQGATDEIGAYLSYMANNPGLAISQVAGSFAIPGVAARGATKLAGAAGLGQKAASRFGLGAVSATSGAMAGGDAAGSAYDLVKRTPKKILEQNTEYRELAATMGEEQALEEIATRAARKASAMPAAIGAALGPLGAERILAGAGRAMTASRLKNAGITGGIESFTEGFEEGVTQYSGQKAASQYNPTIDPMKGVAGAATMGAVMGAGPGIVTGALETPAAPNPLQPVIDQAEKPGSVLSRAVVATGAADQAAAQQAAQTSAADPISGRVAAAEQVIRDAGVLEKLRGLGPQMGAENLTNDFLYALQVARNPNSRPDQRQAAIEQVEQAIQWTQTGFTSPAPQAPQKPGTAVAVRPDNAVGPVGQPQFFDPNVVDVDATDVSNSLPGPAASEQPALAGPEDLPQIGMDDADTGNLLVDSQGNVTPETRVDQINTNQARSELTEVNRGGPGFEQQVAPGQQAPDAETRVASREQQKVAPATVTNPANQTTPAGSGTAVGRRRSQTIQQLVDQGFETVERREGEGGGFFLKNSKTGAEIKLDGMADAAMARNLIQKSIRAQADQSPNSPRNDLPESTEAQNKAGNYKKPPVSLNGFTIRVENPAGSVRRGTDKDGKAWESEMKSDYGYIEGTKAKDGDGVDVVIGNRADSSKIFVIDQVNPDGSFDEPKVVMGVTDEDHARRTYLSNYEEGWTGLGAITEMTRDQFNDWLKSGGPMKATALGKKPAAQKPAAQPTTSAAPQEQPAGNQKARWIKAITDENRSATDAGVQLDVTPDGKLTFLGDPNATQQGRRLLATLAEARKAGATDAEIAEAVKAKRGFKYPGGKRQGSFDTLEEAKQYLSQQRRANGSVSGLPLQLSDGSFTVAAKGTPQYAEAERQRDQRERSGKQIEQGDFFTVKDGGKQRKLKRVKKSELPKKAASVRRLGEPRAITQEEAGLIEQIAAVLGKRVVFFQAQDGRIGDGFFDPTQPDALFVATETTVNPLAVFGHEFFHDLRETNPEAWNAIAAVVRARVADPKGFRADYYGEQAAEQLGDAPLSNERGGELEELVSDLGGNLMMDATFWRDVFAKIQEDNGANGKGIIARLAAALEQFVARVVNVMKQGGFRADSFVTDLGDVRKAYRDGLADYIKAAGLRQASMAAEVKRAERDIKKSSDKSDKGLTVEGYHFSQQPRAVLTTGMFGTGLKGSAREEIMNADDARLRQRLYFYVDKGTGINPEAGVGGYAHKATLTGIYDADADPLRLRGADARAFESKVLNAGFKGYLSRLEGTQSGQVILLGAQTVRPELLRAGKVTGAKVVPQPEQRQADLGDRIMSIQGLPAGSLAPARWAEVLMSRDPELAAQLLDIGALQGGQAMYKDELAGRARALGQDIRKSADRARTEYADVEAKFKGTDAWLKAPNGKPTNLSERQWVQVRTPSFKKWFGDWEKHATAENPVGSLWSDDTVSKAVDKNGEPLVVYHGTDKGGFTSFEEPGGTGRGDLGIWTTPNYGMARSYVRKGRARDIELESDPQTREDFERLDYSFDENSDGKIELTTPDGYFQGEFDTEQEAVEYAMDTLDSRDAAGTQPGVYALFIDIKNPNEDNFEGAMWNGEREDQYQVRDENDEPIYDDEGRSVFSYSTAEALVAQNPGAELQPADPHHNTTDDVVAEARRYKNDGAIIREVIDDGGGVGYDLEPSDIFVTFDPRQVKSADYNNGEFSDNTDDIRKSAGRLIREDDFEMSTRIPTAKGKAVEDHVADLLISDFHSGKSQEKWINSVANLVTQYPNYREVDSAKTPEKKLERLIRQMTDNLVWLHNQVPESTRQRSKLWYDGASAIASRMSKRYDISKPQAAGILAALSPQKDWFMNVSLADRVASIMAERQQFRWSPEMEQTASRIYKGEQYQVALGQVRGKTLAQLDGDDYLASVWLRVYDQTYNSRAFDIVSPEGDSLAKAQTKKGVDANVAWGGNSTIAKAVSIFRDGGAGNISDQLGNKHKVRNFYNNILVPNSRNGHVTIDTHAVAAALLRPLSGNSVEVKHNFGGTSNAITGLQGTYALYEEAYRRAAEELGLLPRELQSITWEAIRGMYVPGFKSQAKNVESIDKIWTQFKKGRLSYDGAREFALETAGGIEAPSWLGRNPGIYVEEQLAAESEDVSGDGVPGGGSDEVVIRADGDDSGAAAQDVRASRDRAGRDQGGSDSQGAGAQDGAGRFAPLPGYAHGNIKGAAGPDPRIVEVAEQYARDNGIPYRRQAEYVQVDPERAARIAAAYEAMPHDPQNPRVKEAFENLIRQTRAQYDALVDAGYEFTFFDSNSDPYQGNPWSAMRDLRANKRMAVYGTYDGYGTEGITAKAADDNPMLADTGLQWKDQSGQLRPVAANDLFRAVHDAFGHGLEGAGFRAQGEENAWQAHVRLFTGSAVAAITTETRGQNSWLNYGPYGETNRTANLEGTVFAEQKTGLMPEWTWNEGVADDMSAGDTTYNQRVQALKDLISCLQK